MVSGLQPTTKRGGGTNRSAPLFTYGQKFDELFPYYLAIGMTYEQYWEQDCTLVIPYRKAVEIRQDLDNQHAWLQGMYVYEAICCVAPILRPFSKVKKPLAYRSEPYGFNTSHGKDKMEKRQENSDKKALVAMQALMLQHNKKFEKKEGETSG